MRIKSLLLFPIYFQNTRTLTEGAGSLALAALLFGKVKISKGESVGVILCGSNIDLPTLQRAHSLGLRSMGKVLHCSIKINDVAGQLARVARAALIANVDLRQVRHDRHTDASLWSECILRCELQSPSFAEQVKFLELLSEANFEVTIDGREIVPEHTIVYAPFDASVVRMYNRRSVDTESDRKKWLETMEMVHK
ncbi:hypothetical protein GEMRC1_012217 [Eukaryota sp. GEM-RC1]